MSEGPSAAGSVAKEFMPLWLAIYVRYTFLYQIFSKHERKFKHSYFE